MLIIRDKQMEELKEGQRQQLENDLVRHLCEVLPENFGDRNKNNVLMIVRQGIESAALYNFVSRHCIQKYVELTATLGDNFDCNPDLAWAGEILNNPTVISSNLRMIQLYARALQHSPELRRLNANRTKI